LQAPCSRIVAQRFIVRGEYWIMSKPQTSCYVKPALCTTSTPFSRIPFKAKGNIAYDDAAGKGEKKKLTIFYIYGRHCDSRKAGGLLPFLPSSKINPRHNCYPRMATMADKGQDRGGCDLHSICIESSATEECLQRLRIYHSSHIPRLNCLTQVSSG
jgi:hypothetical protein